MVVTGTVVRKPLVLLSGGLVWAASRSWLNAAVVLKTKLSADSTESGMSWNESFWFDNLSALCSEGTFYLWMYALVVSLVIYPCIYLGLRRYDEWVEKNGRDVCKLSNEKQLERKIVRCCACVCGPAFLSDSFSTILLTAPM